MALGKTVGEIECGMSYAEYVEWMAFATTEPIGEQRADLRSGIVASTVANALIGGRKDGKAFVPADFMPLIERKKKTPEEISREIEAKIENFMRRYQ